MIGEEMKMRHAPRSFLLVAVVFAQTCAIAVSDAELNCSTEMNADAKAPTCRRAAEGGVRVLFIGNSITLHAPKPSIGICRGSEITDIVASDIVNAAVEKRAAGRSIRRDWRLMGGLGQTAAPDRRGQTSSGDRYTTSA